MSSGKMDSETAEIEPAKIPGNYMARKNQRWVPASPQQTHNFLDSDAIHQNIPKSHVSPAQMYSTDSGKLYHAGSICIVLVGLPGRGKTNLSIGLCRYLRWLGVRTQLFHLSDYRRKKETSVSHQYFESLPSDANLLKFKLQLRERAIEDMVDYFKNQDGQIAIYDAINGSCSERLEMNEYFEKNNVKCLFIESTIDDDELLKANIKDAIKSPDYIDWEKTDAIIDFEKRIHHSEKKYEPLNENSLAYIKTINFGEKILINELKHDFLITKIIFYILNTKIKSHSIYFARCSLNTLAFKADPDITQGGKDFIKKIYCTLSSDYKDEIPKDLMVWTSTRLRTMQSSQIFKDLGLRVKHRPELTQLNPGAAEGLNDDYLQEKMPEDFEKHMQDPYHHRYPRGESYHDLALKIEPLILEMEKASNDVLIIADETITRIFYGYLMASNANDIPFIEFPKNEIIKISYHAYGNIAKRLIVEGVELDQI
ncbi:bifunctional fructose-2,6-bisphosphate 2-phosphatase/6-phosphofructo-2-kinase [Martiniozyma asiatica (nom. inval.)]|nr:bifunctional fructose-2,6-bisphosphate 2-phosphatase/6-phosphofructo-2-kinase [Martiniozyma asiatica]